MSDQKIFPCFDPCIYFSQKKKKKKKKKIIRFATLLFRKQALTPANSIKLFDTLVGKNSTVKKKDSWKFRKFFMNTSGNSTSFLIDPWNFHMLFF